MALLAVSVFSAGCAGPASSTQPVAACAFPVHASPGLGSQAFYRVDGYPWVASIGNVISDGKRWGWSRGTLDLPDDSEMAILVAPAPTTTLSANLVPTPTAQIDYWFRPAGETQWGLGVREEVRQTDGQTLAATYPSEFVLAAGSLHSTFFTMANRPPLWGASLFWDQATPGNGSVEGIPATVFPGVPMQTGRITWTTTATDEDGVCMGHARLLFDHPDSGLPTYSMALDFGPDSPFPVRVQTQEEGRAPGQEFPFTARLERWSPASGETLARFQAVTGQPAITLDGPASRQVDEPANQPFPTSLGQADQAIRSDVLNGLWLQAHPDAVPQSMRHLMGVDLVVDSWTISYADGSDAMSFRVDRLNDALAPLRPFEITSEADSVQGDIESSVRLGLGDLYAAHTMLYGEQAEVLDCNLVAKTCGVGIHASTGWYYAGETGGGLVFSGLYFEMERGYLMQDTSFDESVLGPFTGPA